MRAAANPAIASLLQPTPPRAGSLSSLAAFEYRRHETKNCHYATLAGRDFCFA